jgi:hypothetical protein
MADRSVQQSAAYEALSVGGKRVLQVIEDEVGNDGSAISLGRFMERGMCRAAARYGIKQVEALGFAVIGMGPRRVNVFRLADGWRALDAHEAKRRVKLARLAMPQRQSAPPKPVTQFKVPVERPRMSPAAVRGDHQAFF